MINFDLDLREFPLSTKLRKNVDPAINSVPTYTYKTSICNINRFTAASGYLLLKTFGYFKRQLYNSLLFMLLLIIVTKSNYLHSLEPQSVKL